MEPRAAVAEYGNDRFTLTVGTQASPDTGTPWRTFSAWTATRCALFPRGRRLLRHEGRHLQRVCRAALRPPAASAARSDGPPTARKAFCRIIPVEQVRWSWSSAWTLTATFSRCGSTAFGDLGAYVTAMGALPATTVTSRNIISVYKTPAISYNVRCVFTNTVPTGPYRGAGAAGEQVLPRAADRQGRHGNAARPDRIAAAAT